MATYVLSLIAVSTTSSRTMAGMAISRFETQLLTASKRPRK